MSYNIYTFLYYFSIELYNEICCEYINICIQWIYLPSINNNANIVKYIIRLLASIIPYMYHVQYIAFFINYILYFIRYYAIICILKKECFFYHIKNL